MTTSEQIVENFTKELAEIKLAIKTQGELLGTINENIGHLKGSMSAVEKCCTEMKNTASQVSSSSVKSPQEQKGPILSGKEKEEAEAPGTSELQRQLHDLQHQNAALQH